MKRRLSKEERGEEEVEQRGEWVKKRLSKEDRGEEEVEQRGEG